MADPLQEPRASLVTRPVECGSVSAMQTAPSRPVAREVLRAQLEQAALRALQREYAALNYGLFRDRLRPPVLALSNSLGTLGRWVAGDRRLEFSRDLLATQPWPAVVEVLKHEMAHQYVHEHLGIRDEASHGPRFREVCSKRGIDSRAAGIPDIPDQPNAQTRGSRDARGRRTLERVSKLLALAQSPNEHEAHAAMQAARQLMLKQNLEAVKSHEELPYGVRHIGRPTGRVSQAERILAAILSDHFFVEVIWIPVWRVLEAKRGSVLEVCGTEPNLELAVYVHGFLTHTAQRLWLRHRTIDGAPQRDRLAYLAGVMRGFKDKLEQQSAASKNTDLVWLGDQELTRFLRRRHPHMRWERRSSRAAAEAYGHGKRAGKGIVLQRAVRADSSASGGGLLPKPR